MKRKVIVSILAIIFCVSCLTTNAMAIGLGFNLSVGGGHTEWDIEDQYIYNTEKDESDDTRVGIGFIFDTAVAKNSFFNYRLNIGSESVEYDFDKSGKYETSGWFMAHDFGFAIVRKKNLRLWAGPEIRFSYSEGDLDDASVNSEINIFSVGVGPVIGLNLNFNKGITLALKAGALAMSSTGEIDVKNFLAPADPDFELEGEGSCGFINVGLIFRLGDEYKK